MNQKTSFGTDVRTGTRLLISLLLITLSLPVPLPAQAGQVGTPAPSFSLKDQKGDALDSSFYTGRILLVNFWSPWCIPCRQELSALRDLHQRYRTKGVEIVAIAVDASEQQLAAVVRTHGITYPVFPDTSRTLFEAYGCTHLPTTFIIGRDGIIKQVSKGFGKENPQLYEQKIIELLK